MVFIFKISSADLLKTFASKVLIFFLLIQGIFACQNPENEGQIPVYKNKLQLPKTGLEIELRQETNTIVPSNQGEIIFSIGDITRGQTEVTMIDGDHIIFQQHMKQGELETFSIYTDSYTLECQVIENKIIRTDVATFLIQKSTDINIQASQFIEEEKIENLIQTVKTADIIFIRNGSEYNGKKAAEHLRSKYEQAGGKIQTLDAFIKHIASKSSVSGKPYQVKLSNGKVLPAAEWYKTVIE